MLAQRGCLAPSAEAPPPPEPEGARQRLHPEGCTVEYRAEPAGHGCSFDSSRPSLLSHLALPAEQGFRWSAA